MGLTKEQIEEFLEREKEACDSWDYLELVKDYLSIDGENITDNSLINAWCEKVIAIAEESNVVDQLHDVVREGCYPLSNELAGKIVDKILDLSITFQDWNGIATSPHIPKLTTVDGTSFFLVSLDMAIKLKGEAQQYELEDLIGYLSDPELINDRLSSFDLSDRIKELSVI
tara:strand:+ start:3174 stop:3686 length:513 start_codon:yes stop_codon:yes gene_type:complete